MNRKFCKLIMIICFASLLLVFFLFNLHREQNEKNYYYGKIQIRNAEHLDENRVFIENIYDLVKERDEIWSKSIPSGHYIRIIFEKDLSSKRDITIYAKSSYNGSNIEIYERDEYNLIATSSKIYENDLYRIFLNNLGDKSQDTFDLKINGEIEFDYIVDPDVTSCQALTTADSLFSLTQNVSSTGTCFFITANNVTLDGNRFIAGYGENNSINTNGIRTTGSNNTIIKNITIEQLNATGASKHPFNSAARSFNLTITNVTIRANGSAVTGIRIVNTNGTSIRSNDIIMLGTGASNGISAVGSDYIIESNYINNSGTADSIVASQGSNYSIRLNRIITNGDGISLSSVTSSTIEFNNISANTKGIEITSSSSVLLINNNVTANDSAVGIEISSSNNNITNNSIYVINTGGVGVDFQSADISNNIFRGNIVKTNGTGSPGISVQFNNLIFEAYDGVFNASTGNDLEVGANVNGGVWNFTNITGKQSSFNNVSWASFANGTLNVHWYIDVFANYTNGSVATNSNISAYDKNNNLVFSVLTGSDGNIVKQRLREYRRINRSDILYYSNYTINITTADGRERLVQSINISSNGKLTFTFDTPFPLITINYPPNATNIFDNRSIELNWSIDDDNDNSEVWVWASNDSNNLQDYLVYHRFGISNGNYTYNFSAQPIGRTNSNLLVLMHFDNISIYGENDTFIRDFSSNGFNATTDNPLWNASGFFAGSFEFNGRVANRNISIRDNGASALVVKNFSISAWFIKRGDGDGSGYAGCFASNVMPLTSKGLGGGDNTGIDATWVFGINSTNNLVACFEGPTGSDVLAFGGKTVIQNDIWYNAVFTHNFTTSAIYLNGQLEAVNRTVNSDPAENNITIGVGGGRGGAAATNNDGAWNGSIDEFAIWNKALMIEDVRNNYNLSYGKYYWRINASDGINMNTSGVYDFNMTLTVSQQVFNINLTQGIPIVGIGAKRGGLFRASIIYKVINSIFIIRDSFLRISIENNIITSILDRDGIFFRNIDQNIVGVSGLNKFYITMRTLVIRNIIVTGLQKIKNIPKALTQTLDIFNVLDKRGLLIRGQDGKLNFISNFALAFKGIRILNGNIITASINDETSSFFRTSIQGNIVSVVLFRTKIIPINLFQNLALKSSMIKSGQFIRILVGENLINTISRTNNLFQFLVNLAQNLVINPVLDITSFMTRGFTGSLITNSASDEREGFIRSLSQGTLLTATFRATPNFNILFTQVVNLKEVSKRIYGAMRNPVQGFNIFSVISTRGNFVRLINQPLSIVAFRFIPINRYIENLFGVLNINSVFEKQGFFFRIINKVLNIIGFRFTPPSASTETETGSSGSSSGGGGGGSQILLSPSLDFEFLESEINLFVVSGKETEKEIVVFNRKDKDLNIKLMLRGINEFAELDKNKFILKGYGKEVITMKFKAPKSGVYAGKIVFESGNDKREIIILINVVSEKRLFDLSINIPKSNKVIKTGNNLKTSISMFQVGEPFEVDVIASYVIKDFDGNTLYSESETLFVYQTKNLVKEFITENLKPGEYIIGIDIEYPGGFASSSEYFSLVENKFDVKEPKIIFAFWFIVLIFVIGIIYMIKYKRISRHIGRWN